MKRLFLNNLWVLVGLALLAALISGSWSVVKKISPAPPRHIVMTTGATDGAYHQFGLRYQVILARSGIELELRTSTGSIQNLERLQSGEADVGFVQGGLRAVTLASDGAPADAETDLRALGTIGYEPVWIFSHSLDLSPGLTALSGKSIAVGVAGSGNHHVAMELLGIYGLTGDKAIQKFQPRLLEVGGMEAVQKLRRHEIDAMVVVAAAQSTTVKALLADPTLRLAALSQAQGLARRLPFFRTVDLKRGSVDPAHNNPAQDVELLTTTASLVMHDSLHPALAYLLLEAAHQLHGQPSLLAGSGTFPNAIGTEYPLADEAQRYYKSGRPFLQNYLPFWLAGLVQRLALMIVPLVAILLPFFRVVLPLFGWLQKRRINRRYGELKFLEADISQRSLSAQDIAAARTQLDAIEQEIRAEKFALDMADRVYTLRLHVGYVRQRLDQLAVQSASTEPSLPASADASVPAPSDPAPP
jgi:TRAP transporter TAXI family solute receptor